MKSKLKGRLGDDIFVTELHCERNVVTFCLTVVSMILFLELTTELHCSLRKIKTIGTAAIFYIKVM